MPLRFLPLFALFFTLLGTAAAIDKDDRTDFGGRDRPVREELMTPEERQLYRQRLWDLKTEAERERYRDEQRQMLEDRARSDRVPPELVRPNSDKVEEKEKAWPKDGLRRWPAEHSERGERGGLRRWEGKTDWRSGRNRGFREAVRESEGGGPPADHGEMKVVRRNPPAQFRK